QRVRMRREHGQLVIRDAEQIGGGGGGGANNLNDLADVLITSVANGDVLTYNGTASQWMNVPPAGGGTSYFAGLGIDISGTTISVKRKASGGLDADTNGLFILHPLNSGLSFRSVEHTSELQSQL